MNLRLRRPRADDLDGIEATQPGHVDVHQHQIRLELEHLGDAVVGVFGHAHDLEVALP